MSTAIVDGGPCGPDGAGGQYRNRILTDRAAWWEATGGRQGIRRGGVVSTVAGQMNLEVAPFLAFVEERDAAGVANTDRGYAVWADSTTVAAFDVASASDRMDALVIAFADTSVGTVAFGTEVTAAGGQVVVVPGVSGVTTARTDSDIQAAVGSGGWFRVADVLIASTDTQIQPGNITTNLDSDGALPYLSVWHSGTSCAPGVESKVVWSNVQEASGGAEHAGGGVLSLGPAGLYHVDAWADCNNGGEGYVQAFLRRDPDGVNVIRGINGSPSYRHRSVGFSRVIRVGDGDQFEFYLQASSHNTSAATFPGGEDRFFLTAHRIGD